MINESLSARVLLRLLANRELQQAQEVDDYNQIGKVMISTGGSTNPSRCESVAVISFTYVFIEEPLFTYGHALDPTTDVLPGFFPELTAHVMRWTYEHLPTVANTPTDSSLQGNGVPSSWLMPGGFGQSTKLIPGIIGATIGVVTTALPNTNHWLHYKFSGRALSFFPPGSAAANVDAPS
jgi:hypothetical protein